MIGDYGLNLFNSLDFKLAGELGIKEVLVAHEADIEDILVMDFHGIIPEVVLKGKIPVMTSEYCVFSPGSACSADGLNHCSRKQDQDRFYFRDRKGQYYPILTNQSDCRSIILSHKETNLLMRKEELKKAGINHFRIYAE